MMRLFPTRRASLPGAAILSQRLPRNLVPALIFAVVYLAAMALVIAPRQLIGHQSAAFSAASSAQTQGGLDAH